VNETGLKRGADPGRIQGMVYMIPAAMLADKVGALGLAGVVLIDLRGPGAVQAMEDLLSLIGDPFFQKKKKSFASPIDI